MVEALVVILAFILLDVSLLYLRSTYDTKLTTMRDARKDVWSRSLKACQGGSSGNATSAGGDGSLGQVSGQMQTAKQIAQGQSLTKPLETSLQTSAATSSKSSESHQTQFGELSGASLSSKSTVICNEKQGEVSKGDIRQTIDSLYGSFL